MTSEEQKILDYWIAVEKKYRDKIKRGSEETHYQHALSTIKKLSPEYSKSIPNNEAGRIRRIN